LEKVIKKRMKGRAAAVVGKWFYTGKEITTNRKATEASTSTYWKGSWKGEE